MTAKNDLLNMVEKDSTIYTIEVNDYLVVLIMKDGRIINISKDVSEVLDLRTNESQNAVKSVLGMSEGYELVETLANELFNDPDALRHQGL